MRGAGHRLSWALPALCILHLLVCSTSAAEPPSAPPVTAKAEAAGEPLRPGNSVAVTVAVDVAEGWHINATSLPEGLEFLVPTSLSFELPQGLRVADVRFPPPVPRQVQLGGARELGVYEGTLRIDARLHYDGETAAGGEAFAVLRYQACTETLCTRPATLRVPLRVTLAALRGGGPVSRAGDRAAVATSGSFARAAGCIAAPPAVYFERPDAPLSPAGSPMLFLALTFVFLAFLGPARAESPQAAARTTGSSVLFAGAPEEGRGESLRFEPFTAEAYDRARASKRPFVVEFTADWCLPCKKMEEQTFTDARVLRAGESVAFLSVDVTHSDRAKELILESFGVPGAPATVFFGPDGKEVTRRIGFIGPEEFAQLLQQARGAATSAEPSAPRPPRGI